MNELDERMRQFTVVCKFAIQTCQMIPSRFVGSSKKLNLYSIAVKHFALDKTQYRACYQRARQFLRLTGTGATSDDWIREIKEAA